MTRVLCSNRPSPFTLAVLVVLTSLNLGCRGGLEVEHQTVVLAFSDDEVRGMLVYEGLGVGTREKHEKADLALAKDQLSQLVAGNRFYILHPLFLFTLKPEANDLADADERNDLRFLRKHLSVAQASFFGGDQARFGLCQEIAVRDPVGFIAGLNARISEWFKKEVAEARAQPKKDGSWWDEESLRLVEHAAGNRHAWLTLKAGRISFTIPGSQAFLAKMKREFFLGTEFKRMRQMLTPKPDLPALGRQIDLLERWTTLLAGTPLSLDLRPHEMTISLGVGERQPIRFGSGFGYASPPKYKKELLAHARTLGVPFHKDATAESLIEKFLAPESTAGRKLAVSYRWVVFALAATLLAGLAVWILRRYRSRAFKATPLSPASPSVQRTAESAQSGDDTSHTSPPI